MLKLVLLFRREPAMSPEEFATYWREHHVPLVKRVPGVLRYRISPVLESPDAETPPYDGMAELFFATREALDAALASSETRDTALDARRFIARGSIVRLVTTEEWIVPGPGGHEQ